MILTHRIIDVCAWTKPKIELFLAEKKFIHERMNRRLHFVPHSRKIILIGMSNAFFFYTEHSFIHLVFGTDSARLFMLLFSLY